MLNQIKKIAQERGSGTATQIEEMNRIKRSRNLYKGGYVSQMNELGF